MGFVASIVVSRALLPAGRGEYYVLVTIATTALTLAQLSLTQAHFSWWGVVERRGVLVSNAAALSAVIGVPVAVVAFLTVRALPETIPITSAPLLALALCTLPAALAVRWLGDLLTMTGRPSVLAATHLAVGALQTVALLALASTNRLSVAAVMITWAATTAAPVVVLLRTARRTIGWEAVSWHVARRVAVLGLKFHAGMVAVFLLYRVDVFMLNALDTVEQVGLYSLAVTLAESMLLVTDAVAQAAVARQMSTTDDTWLYTARIARTTFAIALLLAASITLVAPLAIPVLFGDAFRGAIPSLLALVPGVVFLAAMQPMAVFCTRLRRPALASAGAITALVINVVVNAALIPRLGAVGCALASSVAYAFLGSYYVAWFLPERSAVRELRPRLTDVTAPLRSLVPRSRPDRGTPA